MPIFEPGQKYRYNRLLAKRKGKRNVTALLSLTAMVDMFTVLVIFLLQNYNTTGQIIFIPKEVILPAAGRIKELKPAVVVTVSNKEVLLDREKIINTVDLEKQEAWLIEPLNIRLKRALEVAKRNYERDLKNRLNKVMGTVRGEAEKEPNPWNKVTLQVDKGIEFLTVKKVMYTVTEAGAGEINFAVIKSSEAP